MIDRFEAPGGGFFDRLAVDDYGRLAIPDIPIVENGLFAEALLRLGALTDDERYRQSAQRVLRLYASSARAAGPFAATYARALRRYLVPELAVRIVGDPSTTDDFREAARRLPSPFTSIRTLSSQEAANLAMPAERAAYVCITGTCGPPVRQPGQLRDAYDALVG